jgi:hypothetical protein
MSASPHQCNLSFGFYSSQDLHVFEKYKNIVMGPDGTQNQDYNKNCRSAYKDPKLR